MNEVNCILSISRLCRLFTLLAAMFVLTNFLAHAQASIKLSGIVIDDSTGRALKAVRVVVLQLPDSAIQKGMRTNARGEYSLMLQSTRPVVLSFSLLGYATQYVSLTKSLSSRSDTVRLHYSDITSSDVEVIGWKDFLEVRPEKKTYQILDNPNINATNASEVLDQIPSVQVDENGGVQLRGDDKVIIMIDDRPLRMDAEQRNKFLQQLPSMNIERIEVRTSPGAKYSAKFSGGIINIVTRRGLTDYLGANVAATATTAGRRGLSGTLFFSDSTISSSLATGWSRGYDKTQSVYKRITPLDSVVREMDKTVSFTNENNTYFLRPQIDLNLGSEDVLSLTASFNTSPRNFVSHAFGHRRSPSNILLQTVRDSGLTVSSGKWIESSLLYRHHFSEKDFIMASFVYSQWSATHDEQSTSAMNDTLGMLVPELSLQQLLNGNVRDPETTLLLEYNKTLSADLSLELGTRYVDDRHVNNIRTQLYNFSNHEYFTDVITSRNSESFVREYAAFGVVNYAWSEELSVRSGLRVENSQTGVDFADRSIRRSYLNIFPDLSLTWGVNQDVQISAAYNRSIELPDDELLDPRRVRASSTYVVSGNPTLQPEFTNSFEVSASYSAGGSSISLSPFYRQTLGMIRSTGFVDGNIIVNSFANFNQATIAGIDGQLNYRAHGGFSLRLNLQAHQYTNIGSSISGDIPVSNLFSSVNSNFAYQFSEQLSLSASLRYTAPYNNGGEDQGYYAATSLNAVGKFLNKDLIFTFNLADPFDIQKRTRVKFGDGYSLSSDSKSITRFALLTVSYAFGNKSVSLQSHTNEHRPKGAGGG